MFNIILFVYFWLCCIFIAVWTFSSCNDPGLLPLEVLGPLIVLMLSCCRAGALGCGGFNSCGTRALEQRLNSCGSVQFSSVQSLSCVRLFATPWTAARQASLSITISQSSLKLTSIESVMPSSHLILCRSLFLLPPIPPSIRVFSNESTLRMRWPKDWSFSFSITLSKEHPGLISFRMDSLDLFAVQGTLKRWA